MTRRVFHFSDGNSRKFWIIVQDGASCIVRYGRMDTGGQRCRTDFPTEEEARDACEKLIRSKLNKGYVEVSAAEDATPAQAALSF